MGDRLKIDFRDGVADVRLNRADKLNALDPAMFTELIDTGSRIASDPGIRAVVLSGEGRAFSAGLDFRSFLSEEPGTLLRHDGPSLANRAQRAAWVWQEVPIPVIAALHG